MKKIILLIASILLLAFSALAKRLPEQIKNHLEENYKGAKSLMIGNYKRYYEIDFMYKGLNHILYFDKSNYEILQKNEEILRRDIPNSIKNKMPIFSSATKITDQEKNIYYIIEMEKKSTIIEIIYNENGEELERTSSDNKKYRLVGIFIVILNIFLLSTL